MYSLETEVKQILVELEAVSDKHWVYNLKRWK